LIKSKLFYLQTYQSEAKKEFIHPSESVSKQRLLIKEKNASSKLFSEMNKLIIVS